ncbi:MAG TPA: NAD(P)/FAD-dependent oxidoreductase [Steroidobacteraceae bacterium]|nr:NAD(P)/FAD-dependent oxidoreductase [Steroidobacteraceae bacterium]
MDVETVIIGAGVVGLAIGRELAALGREVVLLEGEPAVGTATSSRNSGVIHAGIYYTPGSAKARLCVRGKELLYEYCDRRHVAHRRCGKLIVAVEERERAALIEYAVRAAANGVDDLRPLTVADAAGIEPEARCVEALYSPSTGIIDVHELMQALIGDLEAADGHVVLSSPVERAEVCATGFALRLADGRGTRLTCRELINSAGLGAPSVARAIDGLDPRCVPSERFARGRYYALRGPAPFRSLVYPVADAHSLGIHATLDLGGRVRFGPDVEWIDGVDYSFGRDRREEFAAAIRRYYPALDTARLAPDYTGIRPKIYAPSEPAADFRVDGHERHGIPGLVNLFGIESPGLTASLAIAESVARMLDGAS